MNSNIEADGQPKVPDYFSSFAEQVYNGREINWNYWIFSMPHLAAGEASRLMCGLDPDIFENLDSRPNGNDPSQRCRRAVMIQRLAERAGMELDGPEEWLLWAKEHQIAMHEGFISAVNSYAELQSVTPAPDAPDALDISLLATPAQLFDAFGQWGLKIGWFGDLNSRKWLSIARRQKGQGQRGHAIEPLYCPFVVMNGMIDKVRRKRRMQADTAWRTLEHKFPRVYDKMQSFDSRERAGD